MGRIIITGATGWLANEFARQARLVHPGWDLLGVSRSAASDFPFTVITNDDFLDDSFALDDGDSVVHAAFCRKSDGRSLVESLRYSQAVFHKAVVADARCVVNISSQSVYGENGGLGNVEDSPLAPGYLYSLAKACAEMMLENEAGLAGYGRYASLRLASLMGVSCGKSPVNVLSKFVDSALAGKPITIVGGGQRFSFLDIEDAARFMIMLIATDPESWHHVYNVTPNEQTGIVSLAELIAGKVARLNGSAPVSIEVRRDDAHELDSGGSNLLAKRDVGWEPSFSIEDIVAKTIAYRRGLFAKERSHGE